MTNEELLLLVQLLSKFESILAADFFDEEDKAAFESVLKDIDRIKMLITESI